MKNSLPQDVRNVMGEILCTSVDDCRRKLEGSLSKLGDFVGSWASENLQKLSDQGLKGVKALEAQGNAGFQAMESIQTQVDGTVGSIKDFFSGAAQEATNIVQRYGFINSLCAPDGINSRFPIAVLGISCRSSSMRPLRSGRFLTTSTRS